jgi:hypothetical protein
MVSLDRKRALQRRVRVSAVIVEAARPGRVQVGCRPALPGWRNPTEVMSGQSVWAGCGSEAMPWDLVSLFTNVTRDPAETVINLGEAPLGEGEGAGVGDGDGVVGVELSPPPPHAATVSTSTSAGTSHRAARALRRPVVLIPLRLCVCVARVDNCVGIRNISSKY